MSRKPRLLSLSAFPPPPTPLLLLLLLPLAGCGSCRRVAQEVAGGGAGQDPADDPSVVFDHDGELTAQSEHIGTSFVQRFDVTLEAPGTYVVTLSSSAFDPMIHVTTSDGLTMSNDDFQGSHEHAQLSIELREAGTVKIAATSHGGTGTGRYRLLVRGLDVGASTDGPLVAGARVRGELTGDDPALPDGRSYDTVLVQGPGALRVEAEGAVLPQVAVVDPSGSPLWQGSDGAWSLVVDGVHRVQVMSPAAGQSAAYAVALGAMEGPPTPTLARAHHQLPITAGSAPVNLGQAIEGSLAEGDGSLPSGEPADVYALTIAEDDLPLMVQLASSAFDPYLMVVGPNGQYWENDDFGGTQDSRLEMTAPVAGMYRVVATTYRDTDRGDYRLSISRGGSRAVDLSSLTSAIGAGGNAGGGQAPAAGVQTIRGSLQNGDTQLSSGEFVDEHRVTIPAGRTARIIARSSDFDTYLIVHPPSGRQHDNDDGPDGTNAQVDLMSIGGEYRVMVTSYRSGESGSYELVISGADSGGAVATVAPAPPPTAGGDTTRGRLAGGDTQLSSGEFTDAVTMSFTPGASVQLRLESSQFDTYLIVRTPSGRQLDNDDFTSGSTNSGLDIPAAEAGQYSLVVTSYRSGETGSWTLTRSAGAAVPRPVAAGGEDGEGGRIWGLFVGISDYPGDSNDLPECANDAIRLAETLRDRGLLVPERQVLLTDSQATVANIRQNMQRLAREVRPDDVFVFFYSGHGGQTATTNDAREIDGRDEYLGVYDGQFTDDELGRLFDAMPARISVAAIDACYSGGFAKDVITRPGRVGLFSSEEDVLSAVASQFQAGGYLSYFLRVSMQGDADANPQDQVLTVGELTHSVYMQFAAHAQDVQLAAAYQHLVVDRGAVGVDQVLWSYR